MLRRRTAARATAALAVTGGLLAGGLTVSPAASAYTHWCAVGHACVVEDGKLGRHATLDWYRYGAYNLSNQYGWKGVDNEQTGTAVVRFYSGYNGTGRLLSSVFPGRHGENLWPVDFTPVNSVVLSPN